VPTHGHEPSSDQSSAKHRQGWKDQLGGINQVTFGGIAAGA